MLAPLATEGKPERFRHAARLLRATQFDAIGGICISLDGGHVMTRALPVAVALLICLAPGSIGAQGQAPAQTEWQAFPAEDGRFEAMFPEAPQAFTDRRTRDGVTATTRVLAAGTPAFYCMAGYTEYSASIARENRSPLEAARDDYINSTFSTLLESKNVTLLRPPGTELQAVRFIAIADARRYTSIMAAEGARFYHVVASSQRFGFSQGDVARCLSGFKLLPSS
jgi:hypothetical protein